jgi:protein-tyrosine phosphatase
VSIPNFRDAGGYATTDGKIVKNGLLFRSGDLDNATIREIRTLEVLGVRTIIDLRPGSEQRPGARIPGGAKKLTVPFDVDRTARERVRELLLKRDGQPDIETAIRAMYDSMVDQHQTGVGQVLRILLSEEQGPILLHCRAGKDRTGFVCAVLQLALGVEWPLIVRDYELSNEHFLPRVRRAARLMKWMSLGLLPTENFAFAMTVKPQYISSVLEKINGPYGGIGPYLERCGIGAREWERLKERFLTDKPLRVKEERS